MANDDIDAEDIVPAMDEMEGGELDLDADDLLEEGDDLIDGDDELLDDEDEDDLDEDDDDEDGAAARVSTRRGEDEDDDDMVAPDDVEEDLAEILKDRLASEDTEPDDEVVEVEDRSAGDDALQPKRADEVLCNSCFLLVRQGAPTCPVGDDSCPIFVS